LERDDLARPRPQDRVLLVVVARKPARPAGDDPVVVDAERVGPGIARQPWKERRLPGGGPTNSPAVAADDHRPRHLPSIVDRVSSARTGVVGVEQAPVRALE